MVRAAGRTRSPARTSVWLDGGAARGRARRRDQPSGLDRERITDATVRLLDAEGLGRFSMRRLAADLNVTAMSVYWYVDTKDDLLELALDAVFGELALPAPDAPGDWRDRLRGLAAEYRALLVAHPWVSPLIGTYLNIGPHAVAFSGAVRDVVRATGLTPEGQSGAIAAVFQFVYGFGTVEGHFVQRCADAGLTQDAYVARAMSTITADAELALSMRESTHLLAARSGGSVEDLRQRDFTLALDLLIHGLEALVPDPGTTP